VDAVDISATSISTTNLTVKGNPISDVFQNVTATSGNTAFTGGVTADSITANSITSGAISATGTASFTDISATSLTATGAVSASIVGGTLTTAAQPNITSLGTLTAVNAAGNITQSSGSSTLLSTTVSSLSTAGNVTLSAGNLSLTAGNITLTAGNITQNGAAATASLKAISATSIASSGNITQSAGTATLKATAVDSLTVGSIAVSAMSGATIDLSTFGASVTIPIYTNRTKIVFDKFTSSSAYLPSFRLTAGSCSGNTYGTNGATAVSWGTTNPYIWNLQATSGTTITANSAFYGDLEITRMNATTYCVEGSFILATANNYTTKLSGTFTSPGSSFVFQSSSPLIGFVYYSGY